MRERVKDAVWFLVVRARAVRRCGDYWRAAVDNEADGLRAETDAGSRWGWLR